MHFNLLDVEDENRHGGWFYFFLIGKNLYTTKKVNGLFALSSGKRILMISVYTQNKQSWAKDSIYTPSDVWF